MVITCPLVSPDTPRTVTADFRFRRGDTPVMAARFWGHDLCTGAKVLLPVAGTRIVWTARWPSAPESKTTDDGGGLLVYPGLGFILYPVTQANLDDLDAQDSPVVHRAQLVTDTDFTYTCLDGTVSLYGDRDDG